MTLKAKRHTLKGILITNERGNMEEQDREITVIAGQIIDNRLPSDIMDKLSDMFYDTARCNNIKMCTKNDDGSMSCTNPEWVMCVALFSKMIADEIYISLLLSAPEDLECY